MLMNSITIGMKQRNLWVSLTETSKVIYSFEDEFILGNCYSNQNLTGAETQSDWELSVLKCFILLYPMSSASAA